MPVAALAAASQAAQQLASWRARQKQPCPWQREGPGASSVAFQLCDTEDRACPESLASSHSSCSGADRGGSATGPQQQLQQQHRTLSDHLPVLRAGPCCWEPRTARIGQEERRGNGHRAALQRTLCQSLYPAIAALSGPAP